jgi:hypothetical protein
MTWLLSTCITKIFAIKRCMHREKLLYYNFIYNFHALIYV